MGTEIEMVMEIDTEIDTEILIYGHIAVANVATSPIRSRSAMTRWERRAASAKRWVPIQPQPQSRPASEGGEAAVAAVGAPQAAVAAGEAAVAAHDKGAPLALKEARNDDLECGLSGSEEEKVTLRSVQTVSHFNESIDQSINLSGLASCREHHRPSCCSRLATVH